MSKEVYSELKTLGTGNTAYEYIYNPALLERFANPQKEHEYEIKIKAPEFTCVCPKTKQPDYAKIHIVYSPQEWCVESKALKLYLGSFRSTGAFHEDITNRIAKDLFDLLKPRWIKVIGKFFPRGGISFHPTVILRSE